MPSPEGYVPRHRMPDPPPPPAPPCEVCGKRPMFDPGSPGVGGMICLVCYYEL